MGERYTSASAPGCSGIADPGRKSRAQMIAEFRIFYEFQRAEAEHALSLSDDEITVETYVGAYVQRRKEVVT